MGDAAGTPASHEEARLKDYGRIARRTMLLLFAAQGPGSAGLIAATTVNAIVGADLTGQPALAGLPSATYIFDGAFAQLVMTMVMVITFPAMVGAVASLAPLLLTLW